MTETRFIQIGKHALNISQIVEVEFLDHLGMVTITTTAMNEGHSAMLSLTGDEAEAFKNWWDDTAKAYLIWPG